ncbi:unnamed protein product [Caenorhabditis angaria]|uniref:GRIP domain-containing protein n=1 Tax=Caenorhabditis angaria TaxID=860376 RepID=A0A9P1IZK2_9PELO|nr:unnamed protein product [Caenorhabditis angaria]
MSTVDRLAGELHAERQKLALYERNLRVAVESCKVLKTEKENLANIIAGFACAEIKAGASEIEQLKQKVGLLTKEFQSKESALVLARTTVIKENTELKKRLAEAQNVTQQTPTHKSEGSENVQIAELELRLKKEIGLNKKYEKKLQQLEEITKENDEKKYENIIKRLEEEREQFKKLYEDAHGRSIYLERKFASLQLDQKKSHEDEIAKTHLQKNHVVLEEDDFRITKLEEQIRILSQRCDEKENEISELSGFLTVLKGENVFLKERLEQMERCKSTTPEAMCFVDLMSEEFEKFKEDNEDVLEFLCPAVFNEVMILIEEAKAENSKSDQVKILEHQVLKLEKSITQKSTEVERLAEKIQDSEKFQRKLEADLEAKEESLTKNLETIRKLKDDLKIEVSKTDEMKSEVSKQRIRAHEEIDARDREIEAFRKMLVNFRNEKMEKPRKISKHNRNSGHEDDPASFRRSRTFSQDDRESNANVPNDPDSKNVYYENQLTKKEFDIQELRKQLLDLEVRLRENEQVAMTRQLESVARSEEMTEKVRALEGKLQMLSSTSEIDYLRNIFTQFLHSMNSPSMPSKPILKAMGSVLKIPISEMRMIDKK